MAASADETEIKYEAPPDAALPDLSRLPRVASVQRAETEELDADYYDTTDLRLLRAGITLRRRVGGHDAGWHLKLPVGPATRRETQVPLGRAGESVPAELADQIQVYARGQPVRQVARLSTTRQRLILRDRAGRSLAEVATDDVVARRLDGTAGTAGRGAGQAGVWREIEVELTGGDRVLLEAAGDLLSGSGLSRSASQAKLGRALGVEPERPPAGPRLSAASTAAAVVLGYLADQARTLRSLDPMVRADEPDAVHQMRVTCRRMRSTLQAFGSIIDQRRTARLSAELRWLGGQLGGARDAEVLAGRLLGALDNLPAEAVIGQVRARIAAHFAPAGSAAKAALAGALGSARYFAVLDEIDRLLAEPPLGGQAAERAGDVLPAEVRRAYRRTRKRMNRARRAAPGPARDHALHQARKAAKRARYAAEAVVPAVGKEARAFAGRMKEIQSLLGDHQDSVIARQAERELAAEAERAGESAFSFGVLYGCELARAAACARDAASAWQRLTRPRRLRWMG